MRVISGKSRGTKLLTIEGLATRPTTDRVKEALFNLIQHEVYDSKVLDLFAGSGSLAIESLSRGAETAVLVEKSRECIKVIEENLKKTHLASQAKVIQGEVKSVLTKLSGKGETFDLVFMDPPYSKALIEPVVESLILSGLLADGALIVIEHEKSEELPEAFGCIVREKLKHYGRTSVSVFRAPGNEEDE